MMIRDAHHVLKYSTLLLKKKRSATSHAVRDTARISISYGQLTQYLI